MSLSRTGAVGGFGMGYSARTASIASAISLETRFRRVYILIDTIMGVEKFLPLKPHWFHVLLSLADGEQHGYGIMQEVLERTGGKVRLWPATLYGTLKRLMEADLIGESERRPSEDDDPRRKNYRLTALGRRVLAAESERLEDLVREIRAKRGLGERRSES